MLFGITMFLNVWGVIWRNQKIVIGNAENVAAGGEANPDAPAAAKAAARASRCNTLFSIPMLWFMVFAAHGGCVLAASRSSSTIVYWVLVLVLWAFIEASALGLIGGLDSPFNKAAFDKHHEHDHRRLRPAGRHLLRRLGAAPRRRSDARLADGRGRRSCRRRWPAMSQYSS